MFSVSSGLSLGQTSKRSHMHLSTSSLSNALGNGPPSLHYPVTPCHYSNQQATYGMMAGKWKTQTEISENVWLFEKLFKYGWISWLSLCQLLEVSGTNRRTVMKDSSLLYGIFFSLCSSGDAISQYISDSHLADLWCSSPQHGEWG